MLILLENSSILEVTSAMWGKIRSAMNAVSCDCASSEPTARRKVKAIAVTGTSDSAVWNASAAACCGHLSRAHCARMRSASR